MLRVGGIFGRQQFSLIAADRATVSKRAETKKFLVRAAKFPAWLANFPARRNKNSLLPCLGNFAANRLKYCSFFSSFLATLPQRTIYSL
jgi:hypothetical protein